MASYIESVMMRDEDVIFAARLHWIIYFWGLTLTLIGWVFTFYGFDSILEHFAHVKLPIGLEPMVKWFNLGIVVVGVLLIILAYIKQQTTELAVTNRRVLAKFGIISRTTFELFLNKVESVNIDQPIMGRLLGFGSIHVKGTGGGMSPIDGIYYPEFFQRVLMEQIRLRHDKDEANNGGDD